MANVDHPHFAFLDSPVDEIRIAADGNHSRLLLTAAPADVRIFANELNGPLQRTLHVPRTSWTFFIDIVENSGKISASAR